MAKKMSGEKDFEGSLKELEQIVAQLEAGDLPLERSLELFEQGVRLSRDCQKRSVIFSVAGTLGTSFKRIICSAGLPRWKTSCWG